jgi:hypothetical protein
MHRTAGKGALLPLRDAVRNRWSVWLGRLGGKRRFWQERLTAYYGFTPPFLGPADFMGSFNPRQREATDGLQSTYSGVVAITSVDRQVVQQMLPAGLALAQPKATWGSDRHPVLHLLGSQRAPSTLTLGMPVAVPAAPGYEEMILAVPFVVRNGAALWHTYVVRMYLTDDIAVFGGNSVYGYQKVIARLDEVQAGGVTQHTVTTLDGAATWFRDDVDVPAQPASSAATAALPRWDEIRKMLDMPVLGIRPDGVEVCSYWEWDYGNATIAPTVSRHQVVTKFRNGMEAWETMGRFRSAPDGAYMVRDVRWRLAWPWLVQGC